MTIRGTVLSTFLITLGMLLGVLAWGGAFEPKQAAQAQPQAAPAARKQAARTPSADQPPAQINSGQVRTRFVAATDPELPWAPKRAAAVPTSMAVQAQVQPPAAKPAGQPKPVKAASKPAPQQKTPVPKAKPAQQASVLPWPWNLFTN